LDILLQYYTLYTTREQHHSKHTKKVKRTDLHDVQADEPDKLKLGTGLFVTFA
jgi:hypothetical protein